MESVNPIIPTAGQVGLLPMLTYFFLVVAVFVFLGLFLFGLLASLSQPPATPKHRLMAMLICISAAISGLTYFVIQSHYHAMLADLASVTNADDRQTLIRESYNAIGQYRYMAWFITTPVLLFQLVLLLRVGILKSIRPVVSLLIVGLATVLFGYVGHQQLSFDNEIVAGSKLLYAVPVVLTSYLIWISLRWLEKGVDMQPPMYRIARPLILVCLGTHVVCYFLTLAPLNFNLLHLIGTLADSSSQPGVAILAYITWTGIREPNPA